MPLSPQGGARLWLGGRLVEGCTEAAREVDTSNVPLAKGQDLAPQSHQGRPFLCFWCWPGKSRVPHANILVPFAWGDCIVSEVEQFFTVENNPPSHWYAKSPPVLRHKPSYLINVSVHLYFLPGLILELGIRMIMDSGGQKELFCFEYTELGFPTEVSCLSRFCPCYVSSAISQKGSAHSGAGAGLSCASQHPCGSPSRAERARGPQRSPQLACQSWHGVPLPLLMVEL